MADKNVSAEGEAERNIEMWKIKRVWGWASRQTMPMSMLVPDCWA